MKDRSTGQCCVELAGNCGVKRIEFCDPFLYQREDDFSFADSEVYDAAVAKGGFGLGWFFLPRWAPMQLGHAKSMISACGCNSLVGKQDSGSGIGPPLAWPLKKPSLPTVCKG